MFSLIITIISIALVAALALATLYYGGGAFIKGNASAQASRYLDQGQQLVSAAQLFYVEERRWPVDIPELVAKKYLQSVPTAHAPVNGASSTAFAAEKTWDMLPGTPVFVLQEASISPATCGLYNSRASLGQNAIPESAYTGLPAQCFGESREALAILVRAGSVAPMAEQLVGLPAIDGSPDADVVWLVEPVPDGAPVTPSEPEPEVAVDPLRYEVLSNWIPYGSAEFEGVSVQLFNDTPVPVFLSDYAYNGRLVAGAGYVADTGCENGLVPAHGNCSLTIRVASDVLPVYLGSTEPSFAVSGQLTQAIPTDSGELVINTPWRSVYPEFISSGLKSTGSASAFLTELIGNVNAFGEVTHRFTLRAGNTKSWMLQTELTDELVATTCNGTIPPYGTCTVDVKFLDWGVGNVTRSVWFTALVSGNGVFAVTSAANRDGALGKPGMAYPKGESPSFGAGRMSKDK